MTEEKKQTKMELLIQFIKFGIVGVSNTVVAYVLNVAVIFVLDKAQVFVKWDYIIANTVAFILSVLWSFYWNNKLVFDMEGTSWKDLLKALLKMYVAYAFTGIVLNNILSYLWIDVFLGISGKIVKRQTGEKGEHTAEAGLTMFSENVRIVFVAV